MTMSEAVTVPSVMMMTAIVSEESLARHTAPPTDTQLETVSSVLTFSRLKTKMVTSLLTYT